MTLVVDGDQMPGDALSLAITLARGNGAVLRLLSVVPELSPFVWAAPLAVPVSITRLREDASMAAEILMQELAAKVPRDVPVENRVAHGSLPKALCQNGPAAIVVLPTRASRKSWAPRPVRLAARRHAVQLVLVPR